MTGQTLTEIRQLLADAGLTPRKQYGQNFLIDLNLMRKLVDAAEVCPADVVLEVGPGTGSLSELVLERGATLIAAEIDHGLQRVLAERFAAAARFRLVCGDALARKSEINPEIIEALRATTPGAGGAYKLVANLPYQIATPLLINLLVMDLPMALLACTIQKEVGERLAATAGTDAYGPISVLAATLAEVDTIATLPPSAFWPAPKVDSVMLRLRSRDRVAVGLADPGGFARFVQRGFQQRRKMLRGVLRGMGSAAPDAVCERAGLSCEARPEALSPAEWRRLQAAWPPAHGV